MNRCPTEEDIVRCVDGALAPEEADRVRLHAAGCERCRAHERAVRGLVADVTTAAHLDVGVDPRAHARAVLDRIDRSGAARRTLPKAWVAAALGAAAACAVALGARTHPSPTTGAWQARGGKEAPTLARVVGVTTYAAGGGLRALGPGAVIEPTTPLTAGFRNVGGAPAYLLLFAVDARGVVHWISPPYARPEDDPASTPLPTTARERALGTTAVLDDVPAGPLRLVAVITPTPAHVSDVEALEGTDVRAAAVVERVPGADVRETVIEVRGGEGGSR